MPPLIFNRWDWSNGHTGDIGRFLWTEVDNQGNSTALSNIDFFFDGEYLVGLVFGYGPTAIRRSIGICEGARASMSLVVGEEIVAIDMLEAVTQMEDSIVVVSVLTHSCPTLSLPLPLPSRPPLQLPECEEPANANEPGPYQSTKKYYPPAGSLPWNPRRPALCGEVLVPVITQQYRHNKLWKNDTGQALG